jgi:glycosyltransferase involved in cell wall biosynthesis
MSLCEQLGISQNVRFLGELSREGVKAAMWEANALVLSSFQESFGIVLIEAMSTGLPVVATRCGGPEDIVTEETGILVEPGNIEQLSEAMQRVRDSRRFPRESIRQCACGKYAQVILAATLRNIYERVSSSAGEARSGKGNSLRRSAGISRRGD